jgi:benzoyl-CoA reductase subunit B
MPVRTYEQAANVIAAQWKRGNGWAIENTRTFRDEIKNRVKQLMGACPGERLRLI